MWPGTSPIREPRLTGFHGRTSRPDRFTAAPRVPGDLPWGRDLIYGFGRRGHFLGRTAYTSTQTRPFLGPVTAESWWTRRHSPSAGAEVEHGPPRIQKNVGCVGNTILRCYCLFFLLRFILGGVHKEDRRRRGDPLGRCGRALADTVGVSEVKMGWGRPGALRQGRSEVDGQSP